MVHVGIASGKLFALPNLRAFFPEWQQLTHLPHTGALPRGLTHLVGWGHKPTARRVRDLAARHHLPYLALEDGFVRSYDLAVNGATPWSLVMDDRGIYYDASTPSQLEQLIAATPAASAEATQLLQRMRDGRISKYNSGAMELPPAIAALGEPFVLLVDQCVGDASLPLGYAGAEQFHAMLAAAQQRHPGKPIVIKTHPDTLGGQREGYLAAMELPPHALCIRDAVNPYLLFERACEVHVATSLLGMEALIAGVPVVTHGAPFYAGWGLTHDMALPEAVAARRTARPSLVQLFEASYCYYPRYLDPLTGEACDLGATIDRILALRAQQAARPRRLHGWGFSAWKRPHVAPFLTQAGGHVQHHADWREALARAASEQTALAIWASKEPAELAASAQQAGVPLLRVEDGFLRSAGLGSDLLAALSLVVDPVGIYYDATRPSQLEQWLEAGDPTPELLARAQALRARIVAAGLSKYNLGGKPVKLATGKPRILVVGQVEDDASIARGGASIRTNAALLQAVRAARPDAHIIYKPHPDVLAGNRRAGDADRAPRRYADQVVKRAPISTLLAQVEELHTITSLAGFEMLLRGGKVVTYGQPFYAGWGLTEDHGGPFPRRSRKITLDALVATALIRYPLYHDWLHHLPLTAEQCADRLADSVAPRAKPWRQLLRLRRWLKGRLR